MADYRIIPITYRKGLAIAGVKVMRGKKIAAGYWLDKEKAERFWGTKVKVDIWQNVNQVFGRFPFVKEKGFIPVADPEKDLDTIYDARLYKFATKWERARYKTMAHYGIIRLTEGWTRIRTWEKEDGVWTPKYLPVPDLNSAIRMQNHVLESYLRDNGRDPGEVKKLNDLNFFISEAILQLSNWQAGGEKADQIRQGMINAITALQNCHAETKIEALDRLVDAASLEDRRGRFNPGASAARLRPILDFLGQRLNEIEAISPIIAIRREILRFEKNCVEAERAAAMFRLGRLVGAQAKAPKSKKEILSWQRNINLIIFHVYRFWVSPYYPVYDRAVKLLEEARRCLSRDDFDTIDFNARLVQHMLTEYVPQE